MEINTKLIAEQWKAELKKIKKGVPKVVIIVAKDYSEPSKLYVNNKVNMCSELGIVAWVEEIDWRGKTKEELISEMNKIVESYQKCGHHSFICQLPFPNIAQDDLNNIIPWQGDVDGFTNIQKGLLLSNSEEALVPCTALGVIKLLKTLHGDLTRKSIAIVNRSHLIGLPLVPLALQENMSPTVLHTNSQLDCYKNGFDIVVTGCGQRKLFNSLSPLIRYNSTIVDCSMTRVEGIKGVGDWDKEDILRELPQAPIASGYGHTGLLTVLAFCGNVIKSHNLYGGVQ